MVIILQLILLLGACLIVYHYFLGKNSPGRILWDGRARDQGSTLLAWFFVSFGLFLMIAVIMSSLHLWGCIFLS